MIVIREETASPPGKREALCGKGSAGNSEIMRTRGSCQYRPGFKPRTALGLSILLYRYGVMRHEFELLYPINNSCRALEIATAFH
jgi:hypothetical protein